MGFSIKEVDIIDCFSDITYNATIFYSEYVYIIKERNKNRIDIALKEGTSYDVYIIRRKDGTFLINDGSDEKELERDKVLVELLHFGDKIFKVGQVINYTDFSDDNYHDMKYTVKTISETEDSSSYEREFELTGSLYDYLKNKEYQSKETVSFHLKVTDNGYTLKQDETEDFEIDVKSVTEAKRRSIEGYKLKL